MLLTISKDKVSESHVNKLKKDSCWTLSDLGNKWSVAIEDFIDRCRKKRCLKTIQQ